MRTSSAPTGQVLCLITPDGQRTFAFHTGASGINLVPPAPQLLRHSSLLPLVGQEAPWDPNPRV